jgi:hypothetical protein
MGTDIGEGSALAAGNTIVVADELPGWKDSIFALQEALDRILPAGDAFVLVDDGALGIGEVGARRALPFLEHDGMYWGAPADDVIAIRELERACRAGAGFIVFNRNAFWWLSHYRRFNAYLGGRFPHLVHRSSGGEAAFVVFDLRAPGIAQSELSEWQTQPLIVIDAPNERSRDEPFPGSAAYWERRYSAGGDSGVGSYGRFAEFKADVLNDFVATYRVRTVIEFGCGDGNQLSLARYPSYLGFDVSTTAIEQSRARFDADPHKSFALMSDYKGQTGELALSLDVLYHLVEGDVFEGYMRTLFAAAQRYVIVYASDSDDNSGHDDPHVRHRKFTAWVQRHVPTWKLARQLPNRYPYGGDYRRGSFSEFFIYEKA